MRANIYKAYLASCLKNLQFFGALTVPYFLDWLHGSYTRMFLLQAWFLFWVFTLEIPTGVVADKFGRRLSVGLGCLFFAADMLFFGLGLPYGVLFAGEFLGAIGMTLMTGAEEALLYDTLVAIGEQGRARHYFARSGAAASAGMAVAFTAGTFLADRSNSPALLLMPFLLTAAAAVLAAVVYAWMEEPPRTRPTEGFVHLGVLGLRTLLSQRDLRDYALNSVTISAVTFFAFWFYQSAAPRAGIQLKWVGVFGAGFNLFSTVLLANWARIERALGIRRLLALTALLPAALFAAIALRSVWVIVPSFFLIVACRSIRAPVLSELINRRIESETRATVISSMSLLERAIVFVLYPAIGWLADKSLDLAFVALAALCAVFALATWLPATRCEGSGIGAHRPVARL